MNLQKLFEMQAALDAFIEKTQNITHDVFREKGLALLVELGELANETRCFKFWSTLIWRKLYVFELEQGN